MTDSLLPALSWQLAVADRAGVSEEDAAKILRTWRVEPSAAYPQPHHLELRHIRFTGTRPDGVPEPGPFAFDWDGLSPGVWALASDANGAGKTSVLEIVVWALRGVPRKLQADVRQWLDHVDVGFAIDDVLYRVEFDIAPRALIGRLAAVAKDGAETTVVAFADADAFEEEMGRFMLDRLGLHTLVSWNKAGGGSVQEHGWNALMGAIHIPRTAHTALLGEETMAGLPGRLLQVFLGVPWAQTLFTAQTAHSAVSSNTLQVAATAARPSAARRVELVEQIARLTTRLGELEAETALLSDPSATFAEVVSTSRELADAERELLHRESELRAAEDELQSLKRAVIDRTETALAQRFFHGLNPTVCPRCDTPVSTERRGRESSHHECSVCVSHVDLNRADEVTDASAGAEGDDDAPTSVEALQAQMRVVEDFVSAAQDDVAAAQAAASAAQTAAATAQARADALSVNATVVAERQNTAFNLVRLEGALEELDRAVAAASQATSAVGSGGNDEERVLKAAVDEARARLTAVQGDLFDELNTEITRLGQRFGMDTLTGVAINRAAHVKVNKGGAHSSFSDLTPGERLRLRVAVVVALLRIGQRRQVGRHPGLLLLDSPGAEETEEGDATALIAEMHAVAAEVPNLQVLAATARPSLLDGTVPDDQIRRVSGTARLW